MGTAGVRLSAENIEEIADSITDLLDGRDFTVETTYLGREMPTRMTRLVKPVHVQRDTGRGRVTIVIEEPGALYHFSARTGGREDANPVSVELYDSGLRITSSSASGDSLVRSFIVD